MALNAINSAEVYFRIIFDGVTTFGTDSTTPGPDSVIACDILFTSAFGPGGGSEGYWYTDKSGCNFYSPNGMGGYLAIANMPFSASFSVQIYNSTNGNGYYWSQVFYRNKTLTETRHVYCKPFFFNNPICNPPDFQEWNWLNVTSTHQSGTSLIGCKLFFNNSGDFNTYWFEGRFNMYYGGNSNIALNTYGPYSASTGNDLTYLNQDNTINQFFTSSGTEDFVMNSYNWSTVPYQYSTNNYGTIWATYTGSGNTAIYRYFDYDEMPNSPQNEKMQCTWTMGNQYRPPPSSVYLNNIIGCNFYYA